MISAVFTVIAAFVGAGAALIGAVLTHRFYFRRWKLERIEQYKADVFKAKFQIYRDLVGLYVEFLFNISKDVAHGKITHAIFRANFSQLDKFIQANAFLISKDVMTIAHEDFTDEVAKQSGEKERINILGRQSQALSNACRTELGIEAISDDIQKMFTVEAGVKNDA